MRSRPGLGIIGLGLVLAFLAGLAVAAWVGRRQGWFTQQRPPAAAVQPAAAPIQARRAGAGSAPDLALLAAREAALSAQLGALEARLPAIAADVATAGARAGHAEALLVASAARRALDRGVPLGRLEDQLRFRFGATNPRAVRTIIQAARTPVTLEDLRLAFDAITPELRSGGDGGVFPALRRELGALVVLRRSNSPSPMPAERAARARRLLDSGQVEAALAEAQTMPGAGRAGNWIGAARRYVEARRALDALEDAAVAAPAAGAGALAGPSPGSAVQDYGG